jgi:hypothetical protein
MGAVNGCTPNSGLSGSPVGMSSARAEPTKGLKPLFETMIPPAVNRPHLRRSRREMWPCDQALRISRRFLRTFSAFLNRNFDELLGSSRFAKLYELYEHSSHRVIELFNIENSGTEIRAI